MKTGRFQCQKRASGWSTVKTGGKTKRDGTEEAGRYQTLSSLGLDDKESEPHE